MAKPSDSPPAAPARSPLPPLALGALLLVALAWAYSPALHGTFLWDDDGHITRPDLRSFDGLVRIWTEVGATQQYYPLLHSAFWLEHRLWGDATLGYHLVNLLLHFTAALLFGRLLLRLAVPGAWLAAALFALHPVGVESVAWISEQKNTLSAVFYLLAALAYLSFDRDRRPARYAAATALFLCALLTKTVTASLPAALLVVFWWQRGRLTRRDVLPVLPWFALGAASGLFTAYFERKLIGAEGADFALTLFDRLVLAGRVFWFYLGKLLWPADLVFIYPRWTIDASQLWQWSFLAAALALLVGLVGWTRRSRAPLAVALLFGGTLFPVLGFVNVFPFVFSYVADHFQYLASLALFALGGAGLAHLGSRFPALLRAAALGPLFALLGFLTWSQSAQYRDVHALWGTTLARNPDAWLAHHNLALTLTNEDRVRDAIPHLEKTLQLHPDFAPALNNLGDNYVRLERPAEAIPFLEKAVRLQPAYAVAHRNLGRALAMSDRTAEALPHFAEAVRLNPADSEAELNWGLALMLSDRFTEAMPHFDRACAIAPDSIDARLTYGRALALHDRPADAIRRFSEALELQPELAEAHALLVPLLHRLGRDDEALAHAREADRLQGPRR